MINDKQIEKFQSIHKQIHGVEISKQEVLLKGAELIRLMEIIYQPITKEQYEELEKIRVNEQKNINSLNWKIWTKRNSKTQSKWSWEIKQRKFTREACVKTA